MVRRTLRPRNPERLLGGCRSGHRVVRMHGPVGVTGIDRLARAPVEIAGFQTDHGDAVLDGTDIDAEIAADALPIDHLEMAHAVNHRGERLVRCVLPRDWAADAIDRKRVGWGKR